MKLDLETKRENASPPNGCLEKWLKKIDTAEHSAHVSPKRAIHPKYGTINDLLETHIQMWNG